MSCCTLLSPYPSSNGRVFSSIVDVSLTSYLSISYPQIQHRSIHEDSIHSSRSVYHFPERAVRFLNLIVTLPSPTGTRMLLLYQSQSKIFLLILRFSLLFNFSTVSFVHILCSGDGNRSIPSYTRTRSHCYPTFQSKRSILH